MIAKKIEVTKDVFVDASRLYLLFMVKDGRFAELEKLRKEPAVSEFINEILDELCESDLIRNTGAKEPPFETTAKGDAAADMFLDRNEPFHTLLQMIVTFFYDWLDKLRTKQPERKEGNEKRKEE
jgi:hypothetical protein